MDCNKAACLRMGGVLIQQLSGILNTFYPHIAYTVMFVFCAFAYIAVPVIK